MAIHEPVDARSQQRWIWNGLACGADTILFWCWRDEVFCREAGGYGLIGLDGLAEERLAAMRVTGRVLAEYNDLLERYDPGKTRIGILFSPQSYYYYYAVEGHAGRPANALNGYGRGLVRCSLPFSIIEEEHLEELDALKVLFLPRATALAAEVQERLLNFVQKGGTLVAESECGAFDPAGLYQYPDERFLAQAAGITEVGRRQLDADKLAVDLDGGCLNLPATQWLTPVVAPADATVHAANEDGALLLSVPYGKGRIVYAGTYFGDAYRERNTPDFERFLRWCITGAGCAGEVEVLEPAATPESFLYVKYGTTDDRKLVFVFFQAGQTRARIRFDAGFFRQPRLTDLVTGQTYAAGLTKNGLVLDVGRPEWGFAVLLEDAV